MAVNCGLETSRYSTTAGLMPGDNLPFTVTWWVKLIGTWTGYRTSWSGSGPGGAYIQAATSPFPEFWPNVYCSSSAATNGSPGLTPGVWIRCAFVSDPDQDESSLYVARFDEGSLTLHTVSDGGVSSFTVDTLYLGGSSFSGEWLDGSLANLKHYSTVLAESEIEAELASWDAVRTAALVRHYKLRTPELTDYSGNGHSLTAGTTSPTFDADDPPIGSASPRARGTVLTQAARVRAHYW